MNCKQDLWEYLKQANKTVVLYGMGNGADKILQACAQKGVAVSDVFASDGFVRGHAFHGMQVKTWSEIKALYGVQNVIVLLCFGTSRPEVLENILRIRAEAELYAPDVPVFGDGLFDRAFCEAHREELAQARALLSDEASKTVFDCILNFKLTGELSHLLTAQTDEDVLMQTMVRPQEINCAVDLGAYNGDSVRALLDAKGSTVRVVYAAEPDRRNFQKLAAYAEAEQRAEVYPIHAGAWSEQAVLCFDAEGNRNATLAQNRSEVLRERDTRLREVAVDTVDHMVKDAWVDYIKYDVEGSEREAVLGSVETVKRCEPRLMVSLYHRNEDLFALPLLLHRLFPNYRGFYLRRRCGVPAWDINLYVEKEPKPKENG